jgi:hypothetical protein
VYFTVVALIKALPAEDVQMMKAAIAGVWGA